MLLLFVYLFIQYTQWWEDNIFLIAEPGRQRQSESWDSLTRQASLLSNSQTRETPFPEEWHVRLNSSSVCTPVYTCTPMHMHLHKRVHTHRERGMVSHPGFTLYFLMISDVKSILLLILAIFMSFENCLLGLSARFHWAAIITDFKLLVYSFWLLVWWWMNSLQIFPVL